MSVMHWIRDNITAEYPRRIITHCGVEAWADGGDEFTTALCNVIEASVDLRHVRCKRCLASMDRIATTRRRDRSRVRIGAGGHG